MTEYRIPMFDALRMHLYENDIFLQVVYGGPTKYESIREDDGNLTWGIQVRNCNINIGKSKVVLQKIPHQLLLEQDLIIIPHENMLLMNYILLLNRMYYGKSKLAFWGHGTNFQVIKKNSIREIFKAWTTRQVDWWFAYTSLSVNKVIRNGFPSQRITCLNNTVDINSLQKWRSCITDEEKCTLLKRLNLKGSRLAIFLGGLYKEKRLDFLFCVADELRRLIPDFELVIIGNGPQRATVDNFVASRPWCRWVGAQHGREKVMYASLGQVMLNPGLVGLGILDSFALGIPLLTTNCGIHSPEISYLESGRNGLMVANDLLEYTKASVRILTDHNFRKELANNCTNDSARYSLDSMVRNFSKGIISALSAKRYIKNFINQE